MQLLQSDFSYNADIGALAYRDQPDHKFLPLRLVSIHKTLTFCVGVGKDCAFYLASELLRFATSPTPIPQPTPHNYDLNDMLDLNYTFGPVLTEKQADQLGDYMQGAIPRAADIEGLRALLDELDDEWGIVVSKATSPEVAQLYAAITQPAKPAQHTQHADDTDTAEDDFLADLGAPAPQPEAKPLALELPTPITSPTPPTPDEPTYTDPEPALPRSNVTVRTADGGVSWDLPPLTPEELAQMSVPRPARSKWKFDDMEVGGQRVFEAKIAKKAQAAVHIYGIRSTKKFTTKMQGDKTLLVTRLA